MLKGMRRQLKSACDRIVISVKVVIKRLGSLGKRRLTIIFVGLILIIWIATLLGARASRAGMEEQLQSHRSALQLQASELTSLPSPDKIEKGQIDSALGFVVEQSNQLKDAPTIAPPNKWQLIVLHPLDAAWKSDVAQLQTNKDLQASRRSLLAHHVEVLESLRSVISYNPRADLSESLTKEDIASRIAAAQQGITEAQQELKQLQPYSDSDKLNELQTALETLQVNLKDFDQSRDKNAWYMAVNTAQDKIIANRQSFWLAERDKLLTDYANSLQNLSRLINSL